MRDRGVIGHGDGLDSLRAQGRVRSLAGIYGCIRKMTCIAGVDRVIASTKLAVQADCCSCTVQLYG